MTEELELATIIGDSIHDGAPIEITGTVDSLTYDFELVTGLIGIELGEYHWDAGRDCEMKISHLTIDGTVKIYLRYRRESGVDVFIKYKGMNTGARGEVKEPYLKIELDTGPGPDSYRFVLTDGPTTPSLLLLDNSSPR